MKTTLSILNIRETVCDAIVIPQFEGETLSSDASVLDSELNSILLPMLVENGGEVLGKKGEVVVVHTHGAISPSRVVFVGMGKRADFSAHVLRIATGKALRQLRDSKLKIIASCLHKVLAPDTTSLHDSVSTTVEAAITSQWEPDGYKAPSDRKGSIDQFIVAHPNKNEELIVSAGIEHGTIIGDSMNHTRTLVNEPANALPPAAIAERAKLLAADVGLGCEILDEDLMLRHNMGGILSVSVGSENRARLIVLKHMPNPGDPVIAFVGKGITFDTGGISIKPTEGMGAMKGDMAGAATVIGAMRAIALLNLPVNVIGIAPCAENMPSGKAFRPGDVIRFMNGKTAEIITTDAEGRLVLADALTYAIRNLKAAAVVDVATLTGACVVALGHVSTGAWANNDDLFGNLVKASRASGEYVWQMPLFPEYRQSINSDIADMKNSGGRPGGAISAALFLEEFVDGVPWIHLDIAGTSTTENASHLAKGPTAVMLRTFVTLAASLASQG